MKKANSLLVVLTVIVMFSIFSGTDVLTSPTHQIASVNQRAFNTMGEADCRLCHENPDQFPVEPWPLAYRHHLLNSTVTPDPTSAPYGIPGMLFECISCHERDKSSGFLKFLVERDCTVCHGSAHKSQHESTNTVCTSCHQSNLQDTHNNNCDLCHASTVPEVEDAITTGSTDCAACHAFSSHEEQHDMTATDSPDCLACHVDNALTEHVTNRSLQCSVCHESSRQDVQDAITRGSSGETIYCSDCHGFTSHRLQHESTNTVCTSCHQSNLQDTHNNNCDLCHASTVPEVEDAITTGSTDCAACHTLPPHAESCELCHDDKLFSDYNGQGEQIHSKHKDRVICGICHDIPLSIDFGPQNDACAHLCHGGKSYSTFQDIHKKHMSKFKSLPNPCYWCHGLSVPQRPADICTLCHMDKSGDANVAHDKHDKKFDCTACHQSVAGFGPDVRFDPGRQVCTFCHSPESGDGPSIHEKHLDKAQCYVCHGDSNVYASFRGEKECTVCHNPESATFDRIHKKHAGKSMMCTVCHSTVPPNVDGIE